MKSSNRVKKIHGKEYEYKITSYYDKTMKKIRQKSRYIELIQDGKVVEKTVTTYSYGDLDLPPIMKAARDLNLYGMLKNVVGEHATAVLIMVINRVIRLEAMNDVEPWYSQR
ncbi:MAG: hypothetical protein ACYCT2_01170 [Thermoplasmataceae archaeon]